MIFLNEFSNYGSDRERVNNCLYNGEVFITVIQLIYLI